MADGRGVRPPYQSVGHLWAWATVNRHFIRGRHLVLGLRSLGAWPAAQACDLILDHVVASAGPGALAAIEKHLTKPYWLDLESFGMDSDAEAGAEAMEKMWAAGPGPPPRTVPRPERQARAGVPAPD